MTKLMIDNIAFARAPLHPNASSHETHAKIVVILLL
jgi:hypothetical protein